MSKIYHKNTYFNNNTISIHLGENSTSFFVETNIDKQRKISRFKKDLSNYKERANSYYSKNLYKISKIIQLTNFTKIK